MAAGRDEITHLVNSIGLYSELATKPFHRIHLGAMLRKFGLVFMSNSWLEEIGDVQRQQFYTVPSVRQNTAPSNLRVSFVTNMHHCHPSCWNQLPCKSLFTWEVSTRTLPCYQSSLGKWLHFMGTTLCPAFVLQKHRNENKTGTEVVLMVLMQNMKWVLSETHSLVFV